jgi:hypothetical protein
MNATPIRLSNQPARVSPPRMSAAGRLSLWVVLIVLIIAILLILTVWLASQGLSLPVPTLSDVFIMLLMIFLNTLWHEMGHVIGGQLVGSRFLYLVVGPFQLSRSLDGYQLKLQRSRRWFGGVAASLPSGSHRLRTRRFITIAGGPLASLLLALLALAAVPAAAARSDLAGNGLFFLGYFAALTFASSLIPYRFAGMMTDGLQMLRMLRGGPAIEAQLWGQMLTMALIDGVRPRDLDPMWLDNYLAADETDPDYTGAQYLAYWRTLDLNDVPTAAAHLDCALARRPAASSTIQQALALEAAYLLARFGDDPATARQWLAVTRSDLVDESTARRAEAAVLLVEGRPAEAHAVAAEGLKLVNRAIDRGGAEAEAELLQELMRRGEAASRAGTGAIEPT